VLVFLFVAGMFLLFRAGALKYHRPGIVLPRAGFEENFYEHLGVAFIISGIAGLGYEWLAHHRHLEEEVRVLIDINDSIAERQLRSVLKQLIRRDEKKDKGNVHGQLRMHINAIVDSIAKMDDTPAGADMVSLRFVNTLLRYADHASSTLSSGEGDHVLVLPRSSALLADEILAEHVRAMNFGDTYDVISDFSTWSWDLDKFRDELDRQMRRHKCYVRRIFCMFPYDARIGAQQAEGILRRHWEWSSRIFRETKEPHYNVGLSLLRPAEHVGIFRQNGSVMCFKPQGEGELERLVVCHSAEREQIAVARHWRVSLKVVNSTANGQTACSFDEMVSKLKCVTGDADIFLKFFTGSSYFTDDDLRERLAKCAAKYERTEAEFGGRDE